VLDTRDLTISKAEGLGADGQWAPLQFALAPTADKVLGTKLTIETPNRPKQVRVTYTTSPNASGLQWLEPSMTAGKKQPFMFSQSQQIHARSWVPLQDTPIVRFSYTAHVTAPKDAMVLMSADNDPKAARDGDYTFKMPQKIPRTCSRSRRATWSSSRSRTTPACGPSRPWSSRRRPSSPTPAR
jgi:aminopeptidase N